MSQRTADNVGRPADIHLSEDLMSATVDLYPPTEGATGLAMDGLMSRLESAGVTWGIELEGLEQALQTCRHERRTMQGVRAAEGQKPVKSVPSYWHLNKRLVALPEANLEAVSVDYRERTPFFIVKKGEPVARRVSAEAGRPGRNISGDLLPVAEKDIIQFRPGEHIVEKDGVLYAACSGRFEIRERVMSVNETLDIAGNVDYSTGHIAFPGEVIINGSVCDGFQVAAGKSIHVKQTMDATRVLTRGDLVVDGGIKGRREAQVRVLGRVRAKFIENVSVETHGDIIVEKSVLLSDIRTLGTLDLGESGVLVGGEIYALKGLRVGRVGRTESPPAIIRAGIDYLVEQKLVNIREQVERLGTKRDRLRSRPSLNPEQQKLLSQVDDVIEKMTRSEKDLAGKLHADRSAAVTVFGQVDAGTEIHIAEFTLRVASPASALTYYCNSDGSGIGTRDISAGEKAGYEITTGMPGSTDRPGNGVSPEPEAGAWLSSADSRTASGSAVSKSQADKPGL